MEDLIFDYIYVVVETNEKTVCTADSLEEFILSFNYQKIKPILHKKYLLFVS